MNRKLIAMAVIASLAIGATAAKPVKAPAGGKKISNELIGIFFEDISMSQASVTDGAPEPHGVQSARVIHWVTLSLSSRIPYIPTTQTICDLT